MKYYDIGTLSKKTGVENKYLLTTILSARARKISEEKRTLLEEGGEKYISIALKDMDSRVLTDDGKLVIRVQTDGEAEHGENSLESKS